MKKAVTPGALRVQEMLGPAFEVVEFEESTGTAIDAAAAIGCSVGQIAKSLVFRTKGDGRSVLIIASGANRVDEKKAGTLVGEKLKRADADFVREATGYAIGGVAPVGQEGHAAVLLDHDLARFDTLWAAGGTPHAVFRLTPADLERLTGGRFVDVAKG